MTQILDVYLHNMFTGKLQQEDSGKLSFKYQPEYLKNPHSRPLSIAIPLESQVFDDKISQAFFGGLLPEESVRRRLAKNLQISVNNTFKLLEIIGGECAGAVALYPEGKPPAKPEDGFVTLNDEELENILLNLKQHPFLADNSNFRLSLAGAQDKLPVLIMEKTIAIPQKFPSSHILKIPIHLPDLDINESVHNEFFCMQLAQLLSISVPKTEIRRCKNLPFLLIQRYDREMGKVAPSLMTQTVNQTRHLDPEYIIHGSHYIRRLHQEDFCQAMQFPAHMKYQNEKGPSIADCLHLIEKHSQKPAVDRLELIKRIIFNYLIGNADAHGKNFSLVYLGKKPVLAPAYDLLSTAIYPKLNKKMAMKIGSQYDPDRVLLRHWHDLVEDTETARKSLEAVLQSFAKSVPVFADGLARNLQEKGVSSPVFEKIQMVINNRAKRIINYWNQDFTS